MSTETPLAIEASGLAKDFGDVRAVDGVDLAVRSGAVYGVLGPNGAGKTTTIRMLATLLRPSAGSARVMGHDIVTEGDAVRGAVTLTGQLASVDEDLTGRENLVLIGRLLGLRHAHGARARRRAARGVRPGRGGRPPRQELLGRHAPPPRPGRQHRGHPAPDVPGRAHHRARSALAQPGLGHHPRAAGRGHHGAALHPVPGGGRPARRGDRRDRPRQGDRRGNPGPAEGLGGVGRAARAPARPRAAARRRRAAGARAGVGEPGARPRRAVRLLRRRRPRRRGRGRAVALRACAWPTSRSPSPRSTRCSWRSPATAPNRIPRSRQEEAA